MCSGPGACPEGGRAKVTAPVMTSPAPSVEDDATLLGALRAGEAAAFERLVRTQMPRLLAVARRFLRNEEDARDAIQDAFVSAFKGLGEFEGGASIGTWLYRIAVNACLMKLRTRRRRAEEPIEDLLPGFLEDGHHATHPPEWRESAQVLLERREIREFVRECINRLPDSYRSVLLLRDIEELETDEVARLLDIKANLVKVRLHRARQALRTLLDTRLRKEIV